ncbi:MAG: single-stranded-DNA-specific exonuclease RecJ, partial [Oscillospiraceae bacterium]|nr:single-stranded-DNA-specific exonuclease RecJ [Oscillospiraceae bacterium]
MYNKKSDFDATAAKFGIRNITARLLTNRGVVSDVEVERYLNGDISMLRDPMELSDIEKGARIILDRI